MTDTTFTLVYLLASSAFTLVGFLALVLPPEKYSEALGRLWPVGRPRTRGQDLQRRLVGLVVAVMGVFAVKGAISAIFNPSPRMQPPREQPSPPANVTFRWIPFALGLAISLGGLYLLINPEPLVHWSQRTLFPERQMPEGILRVWRVAFRLMGAVMIYSSTDLFRLWLRH